VLEEGYLIGLFAAPKNSYALSGICAGAAGIEASGVLPL
jgi:hypothetical protein